MSFSMKQDCISVEYDGEHHDVSINIDDCGGEWIVCLHGLQTNKSVFSSFLGDPRLDHYSKLSLDFIGFGVSSRSSDFSYDIKDHMMICLLVLDALGISLFHIVGHSLGGMVGVLMLRQCNDRLISLCNLEGNLVLSDCGKSADIVKMDYFHFQSVGFMTVKDDLAQSPAPSAPFRSKAIDDIASYAFYKSSQSIVAWSEGERLKVIFNNAHTLRLFVYGSENVEKSANVDQSVERVEIKGAGHFMILDQPIASNDAIISFIGQSESNI